MSTMVMKVISSLEMTLQKMSPSSIVRGPRKSIEVVTGTRKEMGGKWEEMTLRILPPPTIAKQVWRQVLQKRINFRLGMPTTVKRNQKKKHNSQDLSAPRLLINSQHPRSVTQCADTSTEADS